MAERVVEEMGENFSLKLGWSTKFRAITKASSTLKFAEWFAQGFTAKFNVETNEGLINNLRNGVIRDMEREGDSGNEGI